MKQDKLLVVVGVTAAIAGVVVALFLTPLAR